MIFRKKSSPKICSLKNFVILSNAFLLEHTTISTKNNEFEKNILIFKKRFKEKSWDPKIEKENNLNLLKILQN